MAVAAEEVAARLEFPDRLLTRLPLEEPMKAVAVSAFFVLAVEAVGVSAASPRFYAKALVVCPMAS